MRDLKPFLVEEIDLDIGIFLSLFNNQISYPIINSNISYNEARDILELGDESIYDFNEVLKLFDNMKVYRIGEYFTKDGDFENIVFLENFKYRLLGIIRCKYKLYNINIEKYFSESSILVYEDIFKDSSIKNFPYENLYLSISHNHPKFCFLEVYRILEKLYPIIYCHKIKRELDIKDKDVLSINSFFGDALKLRPKESDSIDNIFEYASENENMKKIIENICSYKDHIEPASKNSRVSKWIYKIRNSSVHLSFDSSKDMDVDKILESDYLIKNIILLLKELYLDIFK